jgi:hypothetical protein
MAIDSLDSVSNGNLPLEALRQTSRQETVAYSAVPQQQIIQAAIAPTPQKIEVETSGGGKSGGSTDPNRGQLVNITS